VASVVRSAEVAPDKCQWGSKMAVRLLHGVKEMVQKDSMKAILVKVLATGLRLR
jgi:hypothetical protein